MGSVIERSGARIVLWIAVLLCGGTRVQGDTAQQHWYAAEARIPVIHITPDEARIRAWREAMREASEQAGVEVVAAASMRIESAESTQRQESFAQFVRTGTRGRIVKVDTLFDGMEWRERQEESTQPLLYRVAIRALVRSATGEMDPGFRLDLALNAEVFHDGDPIVIQLQASRDCYVTVLNLYSSDSLLVVFPNDLMPDNRLRAGQTVRLPPEGAGWQMPVQLLPGHDLDHELLIAIATRQRIPFTGAKVGRLGLLALDEALLAINRWVVDIPMDQRTEATAAYTITR